MSFVEKGERRASSSNWRLMQVEDSDGFLSLRELCVECGAHLGYRGPNTPVEQQRFFCSRKCLQTLLERAGY
jgi:hypothetical protein